MAQAIASQRDAFHGIGQRQVPVARHEIGDSGRGQLRQSGAQAMKIQVTLHQIIIAELLLQQIKLFDIAFSCRTQCGSEQGHIGRRNRGRAFHLRSPGYLRSLGHLRSLGLPERRHYQAGAQQASAQKRYPENHSLSPSG